MMETEEIKSIIDSAAVISLRPGDVVLFRCPQVLNDEQREQAETMLNEVFAGFESVILDGGQDIAVLRPEPGLVARLLRR